MLLGIDFGTTRTIVAEVDRGNYPVRGFADTHGDVHDHFPSVAALVGAHLVYGFEAVEAARRGLPHLRSFKRLLGEPTTHPGTTVTVGDRTLLLEDLLSGFLTAVRMALDVDAARAVVSVPAHAHGAQRLMTMQAYRRAGFEVLAVINEPSAAGFEFTHRQPRTVTSRRTQVVVYDLGGGTFDASLVQADGTSHAVLGSIGVNRLGGDDFDRVLADLAIAAADRSPDSLPPAAASALLEECREAKERLTPQSRRIALEVGGRPVLVAVDAFYAAATPLMAETIDALGPLVGGLDDASAVAGIYLVGGASGLPLVPRLLRETFGRRVHRSPYPAASTAIGLAVAADPQSGYTLADQLSRGFGVFRETRSGQGLSFDQIFSRDQQLPVGTTVTALRRYRAAHNIGHFRYVEYSDVDVDGEPRGDLVPSAAVVFPYDPALQAAATLAEVPVERRPDGPWVEESYTLAASGVVTVRIVDLDTGFSQEYGLRR